MIGNNVDSVAEPIMVVTAITNAELSIYYQVCLSVILTFMDTTQGSHKSKKLETLISVPTLYSHIFAVSFAT